MDNLQAVIQSSLSPEPIDSTTTTTIPSSTNVSSTSTTLSTQRNASAKNDILPDITEENIIHAEPDDRPSTHRYSMRKRVDPKQPNNYDGQFGFTFFQAATRPNIRPKPPPLLYSRYAYAFTQMSAREGLKRFGERAANALIDEWVQLDKLGVFEGAYFHLLTPEQRKEALRLVQLIKEKRCGRIKGRTCADGRKQRSYIQPEDATSPTVSSDAVLLSCMWDAHEGCFVATADVPGAFLHSDMIELVYVVVDGVLVDMLIQSNPKYKRFVHITKDGRRVVYLKLRKALYGTITAARLFFDNITDKLSKYGFVANGYDSCVMNKMINGHQCTVLWHVDDLKISHKDEQVVMDVLNYLQEIYGKLSVTIGKSHTYIGMNIRYVGRKVKISMRHYLEEAIEAFPDHLDEDVLTPAASHIFNVNHHCERLPEERRQILHSIVAKLLYVATKGRPDIYLPIAFLTSRVSRADIDDWKKLKRLLNYIRCTIDLELTLSADNMTLTKWWVDAAYAVRDDYKSQSGMTMSMGRGTLMSRSLKQQRNSKSSTEAEIIAASDASSQILWTRQFLEEQGYDVEKAILYQDNKSAILIEKNGRLSCGKHSKHINIRYFFMLDKQAYKEIDIQHCGTKNMVADYFTKPLQGMQFTRFRNMILGIIPIDYKPIDSQ